MAELWVWGGKPNMNTVLGIRKIWFLPLMMTWKRQERTHSKVGLKIKCTFNYLNVHRQIYTNTSSNGKQTCKARLIDRGSQYRDACSKNAPSTIFWVFGMSQPGFEPLSPRPLMNTLLLRPEISQIFQTWETQHLEIVVCCHASFSNRWGTPKKLYTLFNLK